MSIMSVVDFQNSEPMPTVGEIREKFGVTLRLEENNKLPKVRAVRLFTSIPVKFDGEIKDLQVKLTEQNKIISSSEATTKLNKEMVKYTEEKGKYTDNLLKMYSVLNIVALGLLIYVYKSAGE